MYQIQTAKMTYLHGLTVAMTDTNVHISGHTFIHKDIIKAIQGSRWNPELKCWSLPIDADLSSLMATNQPSTISRNRLDKECCGSCKRELDIHYPQGPMWFVCPTHGRWKSNYTGD